MKRLEQLLQLSKRIAASIIQNNEMPEEEITSFFKQKDAQEIATKLYNKEYITKRSEVISAIDKKSDWKKIQKQINQKNTTYRLVFFSKVAAIFIGLLSLFYYTSEEFNFFNKPINSNNSNVVLTLSNGSTQIISADKEYPVLDKKGKIVSYKKGNILDYKTNPVSITKLIYNELTVPKGKTFKIILSDGTTVTLNSETTIKYPVKFIEGKDRMVYLNGEAYFDVSKDSQHPFIANVKNMNVRVLGTKFNLSSYPEDKNINTVLIEGSVALYEKKETFKTANITMLEPGYIAKWDIHKKKALKKK